MKTIRLNTIPTSECPRGSWALQDESETVD